MSKRGNPQNLKSQATRTKEEQKEISRMGGIASGKSRQKRKKLKDELLLMLENEEMQEKMCIALIKQAQKGNTKAFEVLRDTIGEKPVDSIEIDTSNKMSQEIEDYLNGKKKTKRN